MNNPKFKIGDRVSLRRWNRMFSPPIGWEDTKPAPTAEVVAVTADANCNSGYMVECKISPTQGITLDQHWLEPA